MIEARTTTAGRSTAAKWAGNKKTGVFRIDTIADFASNRFHGFPEIAGFIYSMNFPPLNTQRRSHTYLGRGAEDLEYETMSSLPGYPHVPRHVTVESSKLGPSFGRVYNTHNDYSPHTKKNIFEGTANFSNFVD